jgi:hypothetical protein
LHCVSEIAFDLASDRTIKGQKTMFTATFYFLGAAAFLLAAAACLSTAKRLSQSVELDLAAFRVALVCLSTGDAKPTKEKKAKRHGTSPLWMNWYARCQEKAFSKQKAMCSWTRTLALCAALCVVGVVLEAEFDEPITFSRLLAGFRLPHPIAIDGMVLRSDPQPNSSASPSLQNL